MKLQVFVFPKTSVTEKGKKSLQFIVPFSKSVMTSLVLLKSNTSTIFWGGLFDLNILTQEIKSLAI